MHRLPIFPALFCGILLASSGAHAFDRLGFSVDLLGEYGLQDGEQRINQTRLDQSFDWNRPGLSATIWATQPWKGRLSWGPGLRVHGRLETDRETSYGLMGEAFAKGEYSVLAIEQFEAIFGGRLGFGVLFPGDDFSKEIERLQADGVSVTGLPRLGWNFGLTAGTRRQMTERFALRFDVTAQYEKFGLFWHSEEIDGLQFEKNWSVSTTRLFLSLGAEVSL